MRDIHSSHPSPTRDDNVYDYSNNMNHDPRRKRKRHADIGSGRNDPSRCTPRIRLDMTSPPTTSCVVSPRRRRSRCCPCGQMDGNVKPSLPLITTMTKRLPNDYYLCYWLVLLLALLACSQTLIVVQAEASLSARLAQQHRLAPPHLRSTSLPSSPSSSYPSSSINRPTRRRRKRNNTGFYYGIRDDDILSRKTTSSDTTDVRPRFAPVQLFASRLQRAAMSGVRELNNLHVQFDQQLQQQQPR
mmetsp:Transcript_43338/g.91014  ORF Transcript_43338/g.91014 Transcript_43338/m.91014 type:complete len:244 (-) Transcript_43338:883-1614(-)